MKSASLIISKENWENLKKDGENGANPRNTVSGAINSKTLNKKILNAQQISERKGELFCELKKDRVEISGKAITYFEGYISI